MGEKTDRQVLDPETQRRFEELALPHLGHLYRLAVRLKRTTQDAETSSRRPTRRRSSRFRHCGTPRGSDPGSAKF
jgi:hypothetical protein